VPWESCITLSNDWGWVPNAPYKSAQFVVNTLAEITAKGGCLLLGIGPDAKGLIENEIVVRMHEVGEWLRANGKAIYNTRITPNYNAGNIWFTADKNGKTIYAIYALPEGETLPATLQWTGNLPKGKVKMLKGNKTLKCERNGDNVTVHLPKGIKNEPIALQFDIK
jgi:alpha-L-fucosidase